MTKSLKELNTIKDLIDILEPLKDKKLLSMDFDYHDYGGDLESEDIDSIGITEYDDNSLYITFNPKSNDFRGIMIGETKKFD